MKKLVIPTEPLVLEGLAIQYRPKDFDQFFGNASVLKSIQTGLQSDRPPRSYLFVGPSGTGKTSLARVIAMYHKVPPGSLIEIDAASFSSIEAMRRIAETLRYVTPANKRMIILDEATQLSRQAWTALLKPIEESREGLYWVFCTTEGQKVPIAIKTRCQCYHTELLNFSDLSALVGEVNALENLGCSEEVLELVAESAHGSPRAALQGLEQVRGLTDVQEAEIILTQVKHDVPTIELIRLICNQENLQWTRVVGYLRKLETQEPETTRLICLAYASKALLGATREPKVRWLLQVIEAFSTPMYGSEKMAPLLRAVGQLCFMEDS